jgi:hypothetical protein
MHFPPVTDPVLQEEQAATTQQLMERRVTRSMTQQAEQVSQPQINPVSATAAFQWRQAVAHGPMYHCDQFCLPVGSGNKERKLANKRKKLKRLSVQKRNKLLTEDPAFPFDLVAYESTYNYLPLQQVSINSLQ